MTIPQEVPADGASPPSVTNLTTTLWILIPALLLKLALHWAGIANYGYFRDELYYLASVPHLDFGYVEHPPFFIYLLAGWTALFGDSVVAIRTLSVLAGTGLILIVGLTARALGAGLFAQSVAALAAAVTPVFLATQHFYSMNVFDQLLWGLAGLILVWLIRDPSPRIWLLLGFVLGLGLMNKISVLWLGAGIAAALLLTPYRRMLADRWAWIGALIALLMFLPFLLWQAAHGFPLLEFARNATERKMVNPGPGEFLLAQLLNAGPAAVPIYLAGLAAPLVFRENRTVRVFVIVFLTVLLILLVSGSSKAYYMAPAYPFLLLPGAMVLERFFAAGLRRWAGWGYALVVVVAGLFTAPLAVPILPVETYIRYANALGLSGTNVADERHKMGPLPQHFADMFGWEEFTAEIARVYHGLSPEEKSRCAIYVRNYGEAGAIDVLGRRYGLPRAISGHNTYWIWGPGPATGDVLIMVGGAPDEEGKAFESFERVGSTPDHPYAMPYERNRPIYVGRKLKIPMSEAWARSKDFI